MNATFSPDGRYVAYMSNETGQFEAYIRPFPGPGPKQPASVGGARNLTWARNGELIYQRVQDNTMLAVPVATRPGSPSGGQRSCFASRVFSMARLHQLRRVRGRPAIPHARQGT